MASTCARTSRTCAKSPLLSQVNPCQHTRAGNDHELMDILGLKLTKAYSYLSDVKDHKQVVPFRRFAGGIGRASQAKQFKTTKGSSLCQSISVWEPEY